MARDADGGERGRRHGGPRPAPPRPSAAICGPSGRGPCSQQHLTNGSPCGCARSTDATSSCSREAAKTSPIVSTRSGSRQAPRVPVELPRFKHTSGVFATPACVRCNPGRTRGPSSDRRRSGASRRGNAHARSSLNFGRPTVMVGDGAVGPDNATVVHRGSLARNNPTGRDPANSTRPAYSIEVPPPWRRNAPTRRYAKPVLPWVHPWKDDP